ncbi:hypothetical protein [Pseudonocardia asaccharolytica]|uniref:Tat pathway signal protein n=1 Tax=Pseudonocardia asaccharolytica DSM 44247 = NBRC 16224 TaxID=1123024 RepID=A0A511CZ60_9PSEU|nr:hypothetical protein [Pseudonocardia asaccharolytica]GEL17842.1 hypothetical protein PA7_16790 [Pseudonocardia asaccharolytica DSM 44247 = NBRC 16224]
MSTRDLLMDGAPAPSRGPGPALSRRRLLALAALAPAGIAALGGCSAMATGSGRPDPLIALADQARADAALVAAAIAAKPALADRLELVRAARAEHAAALDTEVARLDPAASSTPAPPPTPSGTPPTLTAVTDALTASAGAATGLVAALPVERVGLVAAVAACCATHAVVLG